MSWAYPCHRADVTGRQVLTKEKPIGHAYGALQELQEKTVLDADIQVRGLAVSECRVQGNTLVLRGTIANSYGGGGSLEERVAALEAALSGASLALNLEISDGSLKITGGLTWGGDDPATVENDGEGVEVTDCGS